MQVQVSSLNIGDQFTHDGDTFTVIAKNKPSNFLGTYKVTVQLDGSSSSFDMYPATMVTKL